MRQIVSLSLVSPMFIAATFAQADRSPVNVKDIVEIERLTHTEVSEKIQKEGKTSVLIITGGTEERGPHAVLGGHTIMSRHRGVEIAKRLGNALLAPVLPIAVAATGLRENTDQPGGVQMPGRVQERAARHDREHGHERIQGHLRHGRSRWRPAADQGSGGRRGPQARGERRARLFHQRLLPEDA